MFSNCYYLKPLPDLTSWEKKDIHKAYMFDNCFI